MPGRSSGVGRKLMTALIDCARQKGYRAVVGDVLSTNGKMFSLMTSLGFSYPPASGRHRRQARDQAIVRLIGQSPSIPKCLTSRLSAAPQSSPASTACA